MERSRIINELLNLIKKGTQKKLISIENKYYLFKSGQLVNIPEEKAREIINNPDVKILSIKVSKKKWNPVSLAWEGPEPEPLPELLKGKKVQEITVINEKTIQKILNYF